MEEEGQQQQQQSVLFLLNDVQREVGELRDKTDKIQATNHVLETTNRKLQEEVHTSAANEETRRQEIHELQDKLVELEEARTELKQEVHQLKLKQHATSSSLGLESDLELELAPLTETPSSQEVPTSKVFASVRVPTIFRRNFTDDHDGLPQDTFALMMTSRIFSFAWLVGLLTFAFQMILSYLISVDQISQSMKSSTFNVPYDVDGVVRIGQFLTIIFSLSTQSDIIGSVRYLVMFWRRDSDWNRIILGEKGEDNDNDDDTPPPPPASTATRWIIYIFLPNILKLTQGIVVMFITFVVIVQSDNIIDLLKDFTALMVLSESDNIIFHLASNGYLGRELQRKTIQVRNMKVKCEVASTSSSSSSSSMGVGFCARPIILLCIFAGMVGGWIIIIHNQMTGVYFHQRYPNCKSEDLDEYEMFKLAKIHFGNGICYGGVLNTLGCEFENGDCVNFNLAYPLCKGANRTNVEVMVGNDVCDEMFMNEDCDFDGGVCCPYNIIGDKKFGDGQCNGGASNVRECAFDNGDCNDFNRAFPFCQLDTLSKIEDADNVVIGNGLCDSGIYSTKECGYKFGDCDYGQIGQDILIPEGIRQQTTDTLSFSMEMSLDGIVMALGLYRTTEDGDHDIQARGLVRIVRFNAKRKMWLPLGSNIVGEQYNTKYGSSMAMSSNGYRIAISAPPGSALNNLSTGYVSTGYTKVFDFDTRLNDWSQAGQTISSGHKVDMTADGSRLAIAAPTNDDRGINAGQIFMYQFDSSLWVRIGQNPIVGNANFDYAGFRYVHLNSLDGSRVLFSANNSDDVARVYKYDLFGSSESWTQVGQDIESVSSKASAISADGLRIAVSSKSSVLTESLSSDQVKVFDFNPETNEWDQVGKPITTTSLSDDGNEFGTNIVMNEAGTLLAIGSNNPGCIVTSLLDLSSRIESNECTATKSTVELFIYHPSSHTFQYLPPNRLYPHADGNMIRLQDPSSPDSSDIISGLHISMSGDGSLLSTSGYDLRDDHGFVKVYELDELFYTRCAVVFPQFVGDGFCFEPNNLEECDFDGGDCL